MKKFIPLIAISLLVCLFIYAFYRTDKTVVNQFFIKLLSQDFFLSLKQQVRSAMPLPDFIIYSLPEGLWVFCITLTSSVYCLQMGNYSFQLLLLPLLLAFLMEFCQLLHLTNGRFDQTDLLFAAFFWWLAKSLIQPGMPAKPLFRSFDVQAACCLASYSIVYLSHVNH